VNARWRGWLSVCAIPISAGIAALVCLPSLGSGLLFDDHIHANFVRERLASGLGHWWDMFAPVTRETRPSVPSLIAKGLYPWWTAPNLKLALFRPLATATHFLDYGLWPKQAWLMHAENIALYAGTVWLIGKLYLRVFGADARATASLAVLLYALDEAHAEGTAWIAGRNTLLTTLFSSAALLAHLRQREDSARRSRWLAPALLLLALMSSEGGVAIWAFLLPYALVLPQSWPARRYELRALWPMALVTLAWQVAYRALGYGVRGAGLYRDPLENPGYFFSQRVPQSLATLLPEQFGLPAAFMDELGPRAAALESGNLALAVAAVMSIAALGLRDRKLWFWLLAWPLTALPLSCGIVGARLMFVPGIAGFALLAHGIVSAWTALASSRVRALRVLSAALLAALLLVHGALAAYEAPQAKGQIERFEQMLRLFGQGLPASAAECGSASFILNTPSWMLTTFPRYEPPNPCAAGPYVLGASMEPVTLTRVAPDAIELEPAHGYLLEPSSWFVRAPELPFFRGQIIPNGPARVRIEEITPEGRPLRVRVEVLGIDHFSRVYLSWRGQRYERVALPALGQSIVVP
jgi:hypothetical protein